MNSSVKFHEVIRPTFSKSFYDKMIDLWFKTESGHLGPDMYQNHKGTKNGSPISGTKTWVDYEQKGTLPRLSKKIFSKALAELPEFVNCDVPVIEFGPGGLEDAARLVRTMGCSNYIPVDCSLDLLRHSKEFLNVLDDCTVQPAIVDFFSAQNCPLIKKPALGVFLGGTIANLPCVIPQRPPKEELITALKNILKAMPKGGYFMVQVDTCQDGEKNIAHYNEPSHQLFSVNHLYRMAAELPCKDFNPDGFTYKPVWYEESKLLAHIIEATESQTFTMGEKDEVRITIKEGDQFHCDNSFKYSPSFFEACTKEIGLELCEFWEDESDVKIYLFRVPPVKKGSSYLAPYLSSLTRATPSNMLSFLQKAIR